MGEANNLIALAQLPFHEDVVKSIGEHDSVKEDQKHVTAAATLTVTTKTVDSDTESLSLINLPPEIRLCIIDHYAMHCHPRILQHGLYFWEKQFSRLSFGEGISSANEPPDYPKIDPVPGLLLSCKQLRQEAFSAILATRPFQCTGSWLMKPGAWFPPDCKGWVTSIKVNSAAPGSPHIRFDCGVGRYTNLTEVRFHAGLRKLRARKGETFVWSANPDWSAMESRAKERTEGYLEHIFRDYGGYCIESKGAFETEHRRWKIVLEREWLISCKPDTVQSPSRKCYFRMFVVATENLQSQLFDVGVTYDQDFRLTAKGGSAQWLCVE